MKRTNTKSRDAAIAIIAMGNFHPGEPLEGYLAEAVGGQTVLDRSQALVTALDYLGVLRGDHPAPRRRAR